MNPNVSEIKKQIKSRSSWSDRARNIEIIHTYFMLTKKKWSLRKSAKYLDLCPSTVCEDLKLARYMTLDPSLERFVKRKEAMENIR